ncbi:hypothetical protein ACFYRN_44615 [Streptomyces sp. NPDC005227]|uniref:hypothetical protein n=1 Tax=Streptomyces sp. NPDC005227 TaxID=3364707 RepID=UPI0036A3924A
MRDAVRVRACGRAGDPPAAASTAAVSGSACGPPASATAPPADATPSADEGADGHADAGGGAGHGVLGGRDRGGRSSVARRSGLGEPPGGDPHAPASGTTFTGRLGRSSASLTAEGGSTDGLIAFRLRFDGTAS